MSVVFVLASLTAYLVGTTVLLASLPRRPALACFGAANQVTLVRAALVALLFGLAAEAATPAGAWLAVGVALLASALDGVDGWLARRLDAQAALPTQSPKHDCSGLTHLLQRNSGLRMVAPCRPRHRSVPPLSDPFFHAAQDSLRASR